MPTRTRSSEGKHFRPEDGAAVIRSIKVDHKGEGSLWEQPGGCAVAELGAGREGVSRKWTLCCLCCQVLPVRGGQAHPTWLLVNLEDHKYKQSRPSCLAASKGHRHPPLTTGGRSSRHVTPPPPFLSTAILKVGAFSITITYEGCMFSGPKIQLRRLNSCLLWWLISSMSLSKKDIGETVF